MWEELNKSGVKARKLEFLQSYSFIDGNEDFDNGNYKGFAEFLLDFKQKEWGGKDNINRLHYIEYPLDNYLKMEYYTYLVTATFGQDIRITTDRSLFPKKVYDFVFFENGNMFLVDFLDGKGLGGDYLITDKKILKEVAAWFDEIYDKAENYKGMLKPNKEIIKEMKKLKLI